MVASPGDQFPGAPVHRAPGEQRPRRSDPPAAVVRPPRPGSGRALDAGRRLWGVAVDVAVVRIPPAVCARTQAAKRAQGHARSGDELVAVVAPHDPARAPTDRATEPALLADYRRRWGIETLFGALKSRGFDLEATHVVRYPERLERLLGLLALAFTWAHRTGQWVAEHVQAPRFNLRQGRRAKSLFRHGLDYLCHLLAPGAAADPVRQERFRQLLQLFVMC
jgi:DDE family transposase